MKEIKIMETKISFFKKFKFAPSFAFFIALLGILPFFFQNCGKGGFQVADSIQSSALISTKNLNFDSEDSSAFQISQSVQDDIHTQVQIQRAALSGQTYYSWILSSALYQTYSATTETQHTTEYEVRFLDINDLPLCPQDQGTFNGRSFTLKGNCFNTDTTRKMKILFRYRLEGRDWKLFTWTEL